MVVVAAFRGVQINHASVNCPKIRFAHHISRRTVVLATVYPRVLHLQYLIDVIRYALNVHDIVRQSRHLQTCHW